MADLKSSDCDAWPPLNATEIGERCSKTPMWTVEESEEEGIPPKLVREFVCKNFMACVDFINAAAVIAESRGHHPDLHITNYRNVKVVVYSHGLKALTDNDFNLCIDIDEHTNPAYSPKWLREHPGCVKIDSTSGTSDGAAVAP
jgi:4a-hydroxytetrahydrobiopterin dehydratase